MEAEMTNQLTALLFIIAGLLVTPLVFIALDFWAGIRKAKQRGDKIYSNKMQRTIAKISRYYNAVLAMLILDCIQISGFVFLHIYNGWENYTFPFFTMLAVMFVALIEIKSIYEPATAKESRELKDVTELAHAIIESRQNPEDMAKVIAQYLRDEHIKREEDKCE